MFVSGLFRLSESFATARGPEALWSSFNPGSEPADGPELILYQLAGTTLIKSGRHTADTVATFDMGVAEVTFDPAVLRE